MKQYIISEAQLETLLAGCQNDYGEWCRGVDDSFAETIRSHPLSDHDAEIRMKERERVLAELERIAQHNWEEIETDEGELVRMCFCGELIGKIEELRGEP